MRWPTNKEQSDYLAKRKRENVARSKFNKNELWMQAHLKATGWKWTRQALWGYRIFDFWNSVHGVAVEVDGPEHDKKYDDYRDLSNFLESGIIVLRVRNQNERDAEWAIRYILSISETWKQRRVRMGMMARGVSRPCRTYNPATGLSMKPAAVRMRRKRLKRKFGDWT